MARSGLSRFGFAVVSLSPVFSLLALFRLARLPSLPTSCLLLSDPPFGPIVRLFIPSGPSSQWYCQLRFVWFAVLLLPMFTLQGRDLVPRCWAQLVALSLWRSIVLSVNSCSGFVCCSSVVCFLSISASFVVLARCSWSVGHFISFTYVWIYYISSAYNTACCYLLTRFLSTFYFKNCGSPVPCGSRFALLLCGRPVSFDSERPFLIAARPRGGLPCFGVRAFDYLACHHR